eukprot:Tbor_TRINITY_DN5625_c3_g5::TRINITY_DN5625_c3_g5_i1::g.8117::m.8117
MSLLFVQFVILFIAFIVASVGIRPVLALKSSNYTNNLNIDVLDYFKNCLPVFLCSSIFIYIGTVVLFGCTAMILIKLLRPYTRQLPYLQKEDITTLILLILLCISLAIGWALVTLHANIIIIYKRMTRN